LFGIILKDVVNWKAVLDILLMTGGLYFLYRTLLRLGTWKIVAGILVAIAIFLLAQTLDLIGIEWIYSNVSPVALIALIVIFQPELRKIFERAVSLRRNELGDGSLELSRTVSEAVSALAQQHRGALIVFPGKEPIQQWISGGWPLNAEPSFPLIMSLFDPNSPGHDGALIIKNGKLTRFGTRLPFSKSKRLSDDYGTRHHAGMGLTEVTDALVLVVSEERGSIMKFQQGEAERLNDKGEIPGQILSHWKNTASYPFRTRTSKRRWGSVLQLTASLMLAIFFWSTLILARGVTLEKAVTVPVEYVSVPPNLVLLGDKFSEVKLHLAGAKTVLDSLNPSMVSVKIDLSKSMPGVQTYAITSDNIKLPKGVKLLNSEPSSLTFTLAALIEQDITVKPQLVGKLPDGLKLKSIEINPQKVRAIIPADERQKKEISLTTTPIYLETVREDTKLFCKIVAPPNVQPAEKRWPDLEVTIMLVQNK
jgi:diadenylate cyclase